jgi:hypothetical protein
MNTTAAALERRPHKATRAVVELLGAEAPRALYRAFDAFNAEHFAGQLGAPLLFITQTASPRALGDYCGRDVHGLRSRIRVAPKALDLGEAFATDVLLHEMVHAWQSEVDGDPEAGYKGHGPRFAAKCNEIGARLGLPPVGVKGRHGLPDCAQWPMCVRLPGYYPKAPPPRPRKASSQRTTSTRGENANADGSCATAARLRASLVDAVALVEALDDEHRGGFDAWLTEARALVGTPSE